MSTEILIKKNEDFLITETVLDSSIPIDKLLSGVRAKRTTGQLTISMNEGGIRTIILVERRRPSKLELDKIREILGML